MLRPLAVAIAAITAWLLATPMSPASPVLAASPAVPASPAADCNASLAPGRHRMSLDVAGMPREVIVQVPDLPAGTRPPAVIAFHGYSAHADQLEATSGLSPLAREHGFIAAYPQALGDPPAWAYASTSMTPYDVDFANALMDALVEQACADPARLVVVGHSMGGGMASDAACRLSYRVAGAVLIAPLWLEQPCRPTHPVPIVVTHALDDPVLPYDGGLVPDTGPNGPIQLSVEEAVAAWAAWDGCRETPQVTDAVDDTSELAWSDCDAPVMLHRLARGGHDWPDIASGLVVEMVAATSTR